MMDLIVLAAAKLLKTSILGALWLVSLMSGTLECPGDAETALLVECPVEVAVVTHVEPLPLPMPAPVLEPGDRIRHLAPPIRVEMTFTPDLLRPPTKDLTL
ncbi:MAG TPA: hypothetical protein VKU85_07505 [bacterium]|nr:hypothetical protein [bacterium]